MSPRQTPDGRRKVLVIAAEACGDPALCLSVESLAGSNAEVRVIAPLVEPAGWTIDDDEDRRAAKTRLDATVACLRRLGLAARGDLGDEDPVRATEDALYEFPADDIVFCISPDERPRWLRRRTLQRASARFGNKVTFIPVATHDREPAGVGSASR